ncbi:hypothetical protein ALC57_13376 [Trachymyrmex cornetzi]|uniref:Uncharacterized protein n=1 Tax=Trachymyrmex cornetzi TaxID=471704 RepID=A0A151IZF1_9HYME|nr:hypothetical protein ALC57_13376 [Trachymyrmex cornetzi]
MNACVRFIFDLRRDEHISPFYDRLGWLNADDRRVYLMCCLLFSILRSGSPSYLASNFHFLSSTRTTSRASLLDLAVPSCRTTSYQKSFLSTASSLWNSLPLSIRESNSMSSFKRGLFSHLRRRASACDRGMS